VGRELAALRGKADAAEEALLLGVGFTRYSREAVAQELNDFGWEARTTKASGDQGVDVIATKGGKRVVLQRVLELHRWPIFMTERIMEEIGHGASV
jgi:HJR/Mrr/RecB family endonuclease